MSDPDIPPLTDEEKATWPSEPLVTLESPFVDARGEIQPLVDLVSAVVARGAEQTQPARR